MIEKLDPALLAMTEDGNALENRQEVTVIVGLSEQAGAEELAELESRGLKVRSPIGDIVTGRIAVENLVRLAEYPLVMKIESSSPMFRESLP